MRKGFSISTLLLLCACSDPVPEDTNPAVAVARICRDGSGIYLRKDGSYTTRNGWPVPDIDKVCQ